jgi:peptidoglycan/LPS O-acetylase OafA/YrhL
MDRRNNFDLIRLLAALEVVIWHSHEHLKLHLPDAFMKIVQYFPGVPIFFTVSGFLIYASFDRNNDLKKYFTNRCKRIFPALWVCFAFTLLTLIIFGQMDMDGGRTWIWIASQVTFFQLYTPAVFKDFGAGSPNGSLWTIPIEVTFYLVIPALFLFRKKAYRVAGIIILSLISLAYNRYCSQYQYVNEELFKLLTKNLLPYLFYFMLGTLTYIYWPKIKGAYDGKGMYWLGAYVVYFMIFGIWLGKYLPSYYPNIYGFIGIVLLSQGVISLAFTGKGISEKLLGGNDVSYGAYLYHMPVVNILIETGWRGNNSSMVIVLLGTVGLAYLSWKFIEQPILSMKNKGVTKPPTSQLVKGY